ncbi:MAG: MATE family efflux transporter [Alphaproteobacteria bacterium]
MKTQSKFTSYRPASTKELISLALPLMLTIMSGTVMFFISRLIVAQYSIKAMNAMTSLTSFIAVFQFAPIALTSISEVFVGQFNGSNRHSDIGKPVWQMIWVALGLGIIYIPMGLLGWHYIPDQFVEDGAPYFRLMMPFAFLMPLIGALSGFYAGRGQVKILTLTSVGSNIINGVLTYCLVLGVPGFIEPWGPVGAACGSVLAQLSTVIILFSIFLRKEYRDTLGTGHFKINKILLWDCLKIGLPHAASHTIEFSGWSFLIMKGSLISATYATVLSVCQNFFVLFSFLTEGLQKAMVAVVSNLIGRKDFHLIGRAWKSGLKIFGYILILVAIPLLFYPHLLLKIFVTKDTALYNLVLQDVRLSFYAVWVYFIFDGMTWLLGGILTASGDTKFMMKTNLVTMIFAAIIPTYWVCIHHQTDPYLFWAVSVIYALVNFGLFYWRYRTNVWQKLSIL